MNSFYSVSSLKLSIKKERNYAKGEKMAKKVRYNGDTQSYYPCSDPSNLVVGKEYEVLVSRDRGWQTDYILNGIEGEFNALWFTEVPSNEVCYVACSYEIPKVGEGYPCSRLEFINGHPKCIPCITNPVKKIVNLGINIYLVTTQNNSVYVVKVI